MCLSLMSVVFFVQYIYNLTKVKQIEEKMETEVRSYAMSITISRNVFVCEYS